MITARVIQQEPVSKCLKALVELSAEALVPTT